jgi:DNA-binding CsgD family transcriptional regulator
VAKGIVAWRLGLRVEDSRTVEGDSRTSPRSTVVQLEKLTQQERSSDGSFLSSRFDNAKTTDRTRLGMSPEEFMAMGSPALPPPVSKNSVAQAVEGTAKKGASSPKTATGFLLMDSSLRLVAFNVQAIEILGYPDKHAKLAHSDALLGAKIRSTLVSQQPSGDSPFVTELRSGRRRYLCRAFLLESYAKDPSRPFVAIMLERGPSELAPLSQVSRQFNLSQREREALEYLLQGLTTKEIANRMNISPNTVKAFLRMIMIKTGVSSRSAIVSKIISTKPR